MSWPWIHASGRRAVCPFTSARFWAPRAAPGVRARAALVRRRSASAHCAFAGAQREREKREETVVSVWRPSSSFPAASIPVAITAHALGFLCRIHNPQFLPSGGFKKPDFLGVSKEPEGIPEQLLEGGSRSCGFVHGGEHGDDGALFLRGEACTSVGCRASASEVSNKEFAGTACC
jgi:hypothetical protein